METIWGIDFGKKYSGNTVICENKGNIVNFYRPAKDSDTDVYIEMLIKENNPGTIFIDAPLTLPGAFYDKNNYTNYFYRLCDQQLNAMSPMFLGGLTARAIQLKDKIEQQFIDIKETYPKALAKKLNLKTCGYRSGMEFIQLCINKIKDFHNSHFFI